MTMIITSTEDVDPHPEVLALMEQVGPLPLLFSDALIPDLPCCLVLMPRRHA